MYQVHFSMFSKENSKYAPIPCNNPTEKIAKLTNDVAVNKQNDRKDFQVKLYVVEHLQSTSRHSQPVSILKITSRLGEIKLERVAGDV